MLPRILAAALCLLPLQAFADKAWVYEFEFGTIVTASRVQLNDCATVRSTVMNEDGVYPTWSCGGARLMYHHFLGRRCGHPLPNLVFECGWRHKSHYRGETEIYYDAFAVRGRFSF